MGGLPFTSDAFQEIEIQPGLVESLEKLSSGPVVPLKQNGLNHKMGNPEQTVSVSAEMTAFSGSTGRMFKKFAPEPGLSSEDLRLLNAHTVIQKDFVTELDPEGLFTQLQYICSRNLSPCQSMC